MKKKTRKTGLKGTEAGAKWDSIFLCIGFIMYILRCTGKKEMPFSFRSAVFSFIL